MCQFFKVFLISFRKTLKFSIQTSPCPLRDIDRELRQTLAMGHDFQKNRNKRKLCIKNIKLYQVLQFRRKTPFQQSILGKPETVAEIKNTDIGRHHTFGKILLTNIGLQTKASTQFPNPECGNNKCRLFFEYLFNQCSLITVFWNKKL